MKKTTITVKVIAVLALAATIGTSSFAQNQKDSPGNDEIRKQMVELSKTGENHKLLSGLTGTWTFTGRHLPPDSNSKPIEVHGTSTRKAIMDGRYFIFETTGGKVKMPWADWKEVTYKDMAIEGYDNVKKKFFITMAANHWGTGLATTEGTYDPATKTFTYEGEMEIAGMKMKFHTLIRILSNDAYLLERYNSRDGQEIKVSEVKYTRTSN